MSAGWMVDVNTESRVENPPLSADLYTGLRPVMQC